MKYKHLDKVLTFITEAFSELSQTSKMERFVIMVNDYKLLTIFA